MRSVAAVLVAVLGGWAPAPAAAQDAPLSWGPARAATAGEASAVRDVVRDEIEAYRRDDGEAAYSLSAPVARRRFPTVERFMDMVRNGYAPLYRPRAYRFGPIRAAGATATRGATWSQDVDVVGADGGAWVATFALEREPDGTLGITACILVRRAGAAA